MKLLEVEIETFMGIRHSKFRVGEGGVTIHGRSRSGKTSVANALVAAIKSKGFGPECIHDDADRWRVLLKFDAATVQTTVRRSGTKDVKVDGFGLGSPQAKLDAVFPDLIDPLRLASDSPAERKRKVLAAMWAEATAEDARRWTGEEWKITHGKHGLEVVKDLHAHYYALRTEANKAAAFAATAYSAANEEAQRLAAPEHVDLVVPDVGEEDAPALQAVRAREALDQRRQQAEEMERRTQGTREKIARMRSEVALIEEAQGEAPDTGERDQIDATIGTVDRTIARLRSELAAAISERERLVARVTDWDRRMTAYNAADDKANAIEKQADELKATLTETAITAPTAEEFTAADLAIKKARAKADLIRAARRAHDALLDACARKQELDAAKAEAQRLNTIVERLDNEAPAELAARANLIPGLSFVDDDIALDGKVFRLLSESEKTEACVAVVKRLCPEGKLLRIDRMEQMDPDLREEFIRRTMEGGWQIIGTVVERGEMRIVSIDADERPEPVTALATVETKPTRVRIEGP
jgi:hypothetical protein